MKKYFFGKNNTPKPPYLDRVDEFEKLEIVRLKGNIDKTMIPVIEKRIRDNNRQGETIDKNILLDFKKVKKVDSATIAFNIARLKESQKKHYKMAFLNVNKELKSILEIFNLEKHFKIYRSEERAIKELNC